MAACKHKTDREEANKRARSLLTDQMTYVDYRPTARPPFSGPSIHPATPEFPPYIAQTYSWAPPYRCVTKQSYCICMTPPVMRDKHMSQLASNTLSINHADVNVDVPIRYSSTLHSAAEFYKRVNVCHVYMTDTQQGGVANILLACLVR